MDKKIHKKRYFPSAFLVIIGIMIIFIIASWIGMAITNEITGIGILDVFTAIWHGFSSKADIILFIFAIGGTLAIMTRIKAIDAGIAALVNRLGDKVWLLIPVLMIIFGLGGTTYGMWEETIAFIPVLIPVFKKAGYGPFTAVLVILVGAGTGCLASTINPFAVGATVGSISLPTGDNPAIDPNFSTGTLQGVRWLSFVIFEIFAIAFVMWNAFRYKKAYASKYQSNAEIKQNQKNKFNLFTPHFVEGVDSKTIENRFKEVEDEKFTTKRKISLVLFILAFVLMILMYLPWSDWINIPFDGEGNPVLTTWEKDYNNSMFWFASNSAAGFERFGSWYFVSVAAIFLIVTIIIFALNFKEFKYGEDNAEGNFISTYMDGVKDMVNVCMLIATAAGLGLVLEATGYGPLIANESAKGLNTWIGFGVAIYLISIPLSILMPSTSGFASAFMPIFAKIAIVAFPANAEIAIGLAMLGFLFANGLANLFAPTSAALMGYTAYAGVPYNVWIKEIWKMIVIFFFVGLILIIAFSAAAQNGSMLF